MSFSAREPMTCDLLFTVTNCIHRFKSTSLMMTTHLTYITSMSFVTIVITPSFSSIAASICMLWPLFLLKVLCSSNWRCHDNVSSTVVTTFIANTVPLLLVCDLTINLDGCGIRK